MRIDQIAQVCEGYSFTNSSFSFCSRMIFFLATLITSSIFINDRLEGIWDRTLVGGIKPSEMLLAHIVCQSVVMLIQCLEIVFLAAVVFETSNRGNDFTVVFLLMLLGFAGMCFGKLPGKNTVAFLGCLRI